MSPCPTPSKASYPDRDTAVVEAARLRHDQRSPAALSPYQCLGCGRWHLTRGAEPLTARIRRALKETR